MIPVITIGLTEQCRPLAESIADGRGVWHYDDVEQAHYALTDGAEYSGIAPAARGDDDAWACHVFYGEHAFGGAVTRTPVLLPHAGLSLAVIDTLGDDQGKARRVVDGVPEELDIGRMIDGIGMLRCNAVATLDIDATGTRSAIGLLVKAEADIEAKAAQAVAKLVIKGTK